MTNWKDSYPEYKLLYKLADILVISLAICFPFYLWLAGWEHPVATAVYLLTAGSMRFIAGAVKAAYSAADWLMIALPIALGLLTVLLGPRAGLYYPVVINIGLLVIFYSSLSTPRNFIQRIAEKIEKRQLDSVSIKYTSYVTQIWCVMFLLNALISVFLAWHQMLDKWTLYNGVIAYLLIAVLLLGERLLRSRVQQKMRYAVGTAGGQCDR